MIFNYLWRGWNREVEDNDWDLWEDSQTAWLNILNIPKEKPKGTLNHYQKIAAKQLISLGVERKEARTRVTAAAEKADVERNKWVEAT